MIQKSTSLKYVTSLEPLLSTESRKCARFRRLEKVKEVEIEAIRKKLARAAGTEQGCVVWDGGFRVLGSWFGFGGLCFGFRCSVSC